MSRSIMFRFGVCASVFMLAGCFGAGEHLAPPPIPVATNCVTGQIPQEPRHVQNELTGDSGLDLGIVGGSAIELRAWGQALYGMLVACQPTPASVAPLNVSTGGRP